MRTVTLLFYSIIWFFSYLEKAWPGGAEGVMLNGGRLLACVFAVIFFGAAAGGMSRAELLAQFSAPPDAPPADRAWALLQRVLLWGSCPAAAWSLSRGRVWEGLMLLALPAWALWIKIELRRLDLREGRLRPAGGWRILTGIAAAALAVSLALTVGGFSGPAVPVGATYYRLYPFIILISLPVLMVAGLMSGLYGKR